MYLHHIVHNYVCVRMCVSVLPSPEASSRLFDITLYLYAPLYCCCCMFCFLWVLTCVACIFFSCLLAAQSVKVARSLSSPNAGISNTAGNFILNAHYLLCCLYYVKYYASFEVWSISGMWLWTTKTVVKEFLGW